MNTHIFPFSIAYADTDAAGIVYHARYIEIAERARMNWMKNNVPNNINVGMIITKLSAKYVKPLRLGDDFVVETSFIDVGAVSLTAEQKFVKDGEIYAILTIKVACVGSDLKPKRIPEEWKKFF